MIESFVIGNGWSGLVHDYSETASLLFPFVLHWKQGDIEEFKCFASAEGMEQFMDELDEDMEDFMHGNYEDILAAEIEDIENGAF